MSNDERAVIGLITEIKPQRKIILKIIQQESGAGSGVRQHAQRPGTDKTFCGVPFKERDRWFDYDWKINLTQRPKSIFEITCSRCRRSACRFILLVELL